MKGPHWNDEERLRLAAGIAAQGLLSWSIAVHYGEVTPPDNLKQSMAAEAFDLLEALEAEQARRAGKVSQ